MIFIILLGVALLLFLIFIGIGAQKEFIASFFQQTLPASASPESKSKPARHAMKLRQRK
jgi:hypothetical protein